MKSRMTIGLGLISLGLFSLSPDVAAAPATKEITAYLFSTLLLLFCASCIARVTRVLRSSTCSVVTQHARCSPS